VLQRVSAEKLWQLARPNTQWASEANAPARFALQFSEDKRKSADGEERQSLAMRCRRRQLLNCRLQD
jgi:hypothetical protein